jgi:uncharacterized tellurite resistance protein B-like protein
MDERTRHALFDLIAGGGTPARAVPDGELRMAAAALMVCMVRADRTAKQDEHRVLEKAIARTLGMDAASAARVVRVAEEKLGEEAPFAGFLVLLDEGCTDEDKKRLVEWLWRIAYADAKLQAHEEYLVRKIAEHLHLSTADLIEAKLRARDGFLREDL